MQRSGPVRALLGLLAVVVIGTLGFFGTRLAQGAFAEEYRFTVNIGETGQGLVRGSDVAARGVLIGQVGQISLNSDLEALVEVVLEPQYQIPADSTFSVVGKTLFGEKQFEIRFDGDPTLATAFIPDGGMVDNPQQVVEVQDVLVELNELFDIIDPDDLATLVNDGLGAFVGQEDSISRAIDQGARATDVLSRSLDDQTPTLSDLSLVAESLGPVGDEFNRLGNALDAGALDTISANQARLRGLLEELNRFSDQLDIVLRLTRPDLDRLIIEGDNVTRMLFAYRPELAEVLVGLRDYSDTIGTGGIVDPGWTGIAAGFQIILTNPLTNEFCAGAPAELAEQIPACSGQGQALAADLADAGLGDLPLPVVTVPAPISAAPETGVMSGLDTLIQNVTGNLGIQSDEPEPAAEAGEEPQDG